MSRLALVTGASSGIGAAFARRLAAGGYDLVLVARRRDRLEALAAELGRAHGVRAEVLPADLAAEEGLLAVERRIGAAADLELLVNNAGFGLMGKFSEADFAGQERMHRLHVLATLRLTHAALRGMAARNRGAIVNVSSVAGFVAMPGNVSYGATKHWMNAFTEALHLELKAAGSAVRVQALCPGFTYSEFHDVMGYDRAHVPPKFWLRADDVVAASLRGLERDEVFVVTGWRYKVLLALSRLLPAAVIRAAVIRRQRAAGRL